MKNRKWLFQLFMLAFISCASNVHALDKTATGFYWPIGENNFDPACGSWLERDSGHGGCYFAGLYHIGLDMMTYETDPDNEDSHVYAIADGKVFIGIAVPSHGGLEIVHYLFVTKLLAVKFLLDCMDIFVLLLIKTMRCPLDN